MNSRFLQLLLVVTALFTSRLCAQDVRITEFLANNATGISDAHDPALPVVPQPWIEIWNPSTTAAVALTSYTLSNGTITWTFPTIQIMPDEHLIIWATGKDKKVVTAPLHTNFTLPLGGGTLTLSRPGSVVISQLTYPAQAPDISWGRDEWDLATIPAQAGTYSKPTPGDRNNFSGAGVSGKALIDIPSGAILPGAPLTVTLSQAVPDAAAVIRYTTNGTVPTASSLVYSTPLTVNATQLIRARVYKTGLLPGETETRGYLLLDASTSGFSSAMPIVVITNFGLGTPSDTVDTASFMWVWEPAAPDNRAKFTNAPTIAVRTVIDRRGSSTLGNAKFNINVEARKNRDDDDNAIALLGLPDGSDFVFSGPFDFDHSEVHNPFMFALSNQIGRYAPGTRFAEVFMEVSAGALTFTNTASGDYFGVYNILEKIRRDKNRVNVQKLDTYDNDAVGKTGGMIWKVDRLDAGDGGFSAGGQGMAYYYPKELEIKSPQRDPQEQFLTTYINSFNSALQSGTWNNPTTGYAAFLDVPAAIDHHLLVTWPMNVDGLRLSGYWFKQRGGKLVPGPIWDFDRALYSTDGRDTFPAVWRANSGDLGTDFFNYTWWNRLFLDINFYQKYIDRWQSLRRGSFSRANIEALLDTLNSQMSAEAINRDLARWQKTKRAWTSPFTGTSYQANQAAEIQRIKDWLQQRANFFDSQWVGPVTASLPDSNVAPSTTVTLTGPAAGTIYYTVDGSDPRPNGGTAPAAGTLSYTAGTPITINATTKIRARAYNAAWLSNSAVLIGANNPPLRSAWGGITSVRYSTDTPALAANLSVSEVNYHPANPTVSELGIDPNFHDSDFEFIELHNTGAVPIDLGGLQFTAGISFAFSGENALSLAPGGYVVIAANPAAFAARYPGVVPVVGPWTGDLSNGGERIVLTSASATAIFDFTYDDLWYPETDTGGRTLVVLDEKAASPAFSTAANWRASGALGGSPGVVEADLVPPVVPGPFTPLTLATGPDGTAALPNYAAMANATDKNGVASVTQAPLAAVAVPVGTTRVVVTAKDPSGNAGTAAFDVIVTDGTPPAITGTFTPSSLSTGINGMVAAPDYVAQAQATDNVAGTIVITQSPAAGSLIGAGNKNITLSATDLAGNVGTKVVALEVLDATLPVLGGTFAPLTLSTGLFGTASLPDYTLQAEASDNVGVGVVTQIPAPGTALPVGTTTVKLTVSDAAGNTATATFDVAITDGTAPVLGGTFAPLTLSTGANGTAAVPNYVIQAVSTDNMGIPLVTQTPLAGAALNIGTFPISLTATDAAGNMASTSFNLVISDGTAPTFTKSASAFTPLTVTVNAAGTAQLPDYVPQATTTDNVAVVSVVQSPAPGTTVNAGVTVVTLTAQDAAGNKSTLLLNVAAVAGVVAKNDPVPGIPGATFSSFGIPSINDAGAVAFSAKWSQPAGSGIFGGNPAALVVKVGDPVPGLAGAVFKTLLDPLINSDGKVAFLATIKGSGVTASSDTVIVTNAFSGGALAIAAREGALAGGDDGAVLGAFRSISLQGSEILYVATLKGGRPAVRSSTAMAAYRVTSDLVSRHVVRAAQIVGTTTIKSFQMLAVVAGSPGQNRSHSEGTATFLALLADGTQALIDSTGTSFNVIASTGAPTNSVLIPSSTFKSFGPVAADPVNVSVAATLNPGAGDVTADNAKAIFLNSPTGFEPVARIGQTAPGIDGATFRALGDPVLAPLTGAIAFPATVTGSATQDSTLWWKPAGGELKLIAREGAHPPGTPDGARWKKFISLAIRGGSHGAPLFYAQMAPGNGVTAASDFGIWAVNSTGELQILVREGDLIGDKKLKTITVLSAVSGSTGVTRSFNNAQSVIYRATFTDNSQAVLTATIP